jgi:hypothetical protein
MQAESEEKEKLYLSCINTLVQSIKKIAEVQLKLYRIFKFA